MAIASDTVRGASGHSKFSKSAMLDLVLRRTCENDSRMRTSPEPAVIPRCENYDATCAMVMLSVKNG
jgi:hypothetical protein